MNGQLELEREILRLRPDWDIKKIQEYAIETMTYWIDACLPDVLEADEA